ncbi:amidohydrolase family protein [Jatrophihabitans fulvus]
MLLRDVVLDDGAGSGVRSDVRIRGGRVAEIAADLPAGDEPVVSGRGGALLPGLHDHHIHLLATAAARASIDCGPPLDADGLAARLHDAPDGWVRGVAYHESVAGDLDRDAIDRLRADVPVRIQHRSGALWMLNTLALRLLGLDATDSPGIERDASGRATGRLWRADGLLRERIGDDAPELSSLSLELASYGITGVTDATPELAALPGPVAQHVVLLGAPGRDRREPFKLVLPDHELPDLDAFTRRISALRPRPVAIHAVTRASLLLALAALADAGPVAGDRIEHAAVAPREVLPRLHELGVTVVTQPSLPLLRGDVYLAEVDTDDLADLWPFRTLLDAGVPVACSSDAPYGMTDPWAAVAFAAGRTTASGSRIGLHQRVDARVALGGYLSDAYAPGGPPRRVEAGGPADLVLLDEPLDRALAHLHERHVALTLIDGAVAYRRHEVVRS